MSRIQKVVKSSLTSVVDIRNAGQIDMLSLKTRAEALGGWTCSPVDVNGVCLRGCGQGARSISRLQAIRSLRCPMPLICPHGAWSEGSFTFSHAVTFLVYLRSGQLDELREQQFRRKLRQEPCFMHEAKPTVASFSLPEKYSLTRL
jgi:hypothetical protein